MWKDSEKEDRTIVNHFHWVSSSADDISKMTTLRLSSRKKKKFSRGFRGVSALEPEVTESAEFYAVSDEIRRWSSLSEGECQHFVSAEDGVTVLNEFEMMCLSATYPIPLAFCCFQPDYVSPGS